MRSFHQAFADIPIIRKLYAGFSAVLIVLLAFVAYAIHGFGEVMEAFGDFSEMASDARLVTDIQADLIELQLEVREYLATREDEDARQVEQAYAHIAENLAATREKIQKPERIALLLEIIEFEERHRRGVERVVELNKRRDALVASTLDQTGQRIREALIQINETAYRDRDYRSANYAGVVQEDLLTARLYVHRFLGTNNLAEIRRVYEEFNEVDDALVPLDKSIEDPERRRLFDTVKAALPVYRLAFDDLVGIVSERNDICAEAFDKIGATIVEKAEAIKASALADMEAVERSVREMARAEIVDGVAAA